MIEARIAGIPCLIRVDDYVSVKPWPGGAQTAPSDLDFTGYREIEFTVCDRRGRPAPWLERKLMARERADIEDKIINSMED